MTSVYAVASGKGGVGKTTTAAALGSVLAAAGHSVVAVDCDLGMPNLAPALGVEPAPPTLHEVLSGEASLLDAIRESQSGVDVVPGSRNVDDYRDAAPELLRDVVDVLVEHGEYDYVLLDTGAGLSHDNVLPLGLADAVLLVSTVDRDALRDAERTREVGARVGGYAAGLVLTKVRDGQDAGLAGELVDAPVVAEVPEDDAVPEALAVGQPLPAFAPRSAAASAYRALARDLTGEEIPEPEPAADPELEPAADSSASSTEDDAAAGAAIPDAEGGTAAAVDAGDAGDVGGDDWSGGADDAAAGGTSAGADGTAESAESAGTAGAGGSSLSETLAAAEAGAAEDAADPADDGDGDDGVHDTALAGMAADGDEPGADGGEGDDESGTEPDEQSDTEEGDDGDDGDGGDRKGFFTRLFG